MVIDDYKTAGEAVVALYRASKKLKE